jgi:hypothetical protein
MLPIKRIASLLIVAATIGASANAGAITYGPAPDASNVYPFGSTNVGIYQQVYNANAFSTTELITAITFYKTVFQIEGGGFNGQNYAFYLSTTSKSVNGLNLSNATANLGADNTLFLSVTALTGDVGSARTFTGTGFLYDPSKGNLLLTIVVTGSATQQGAFLPLDARNGSANEAFSRAIFDPEGNPVCCGNNNSGLVTTFTTIAPTPEPSTAILSGLGLAALAIAKRRKLSR